MESFDQYLAAGIEIELGTDTYPVDIIAEMRDASLISRLVDKNAPGARPADVFNAATIVGAEALGRKDLGRIAAGAKADVVIVNLRTTRYGPARDPINARLSTAVRTSKPSLSMVKSRLRTADPLESTKTSCRSSGYGFAQRAWDAWASRDRNGRSTEDIIPPAFPTRKN